MNDLEEATELKLKVFQDNTKIVFDGIKQLEFKTHIVLTLSTFLLIVIINFANSANYPDEKTKIVVNYMIPFVFMFTTIILVLSLSSLMRFNIKDFLYYDFINLSNITDPSSLKEELIQEITGKYKGLVEVYNHKDTYLNYSVFALFVQLGFILSILCLIQYHLINYLSPNLP